MSVSVRKCAGRPWRGGHNAVDDTQVFEINRVKQNKASTFQRDQRVSEYKATSAP